VTDDQNGAHGTEHVEPIVAGGEGGHGGGGMARSGEPARSGGQARPGGQTRPEERRGAGFWLSAVAGWAIIAWGIRGALHHHIDTRPRELVDFFVGGALIHDLLFAPAVLVAGVLVSRILPGRWRAPVQGAAIISGCLALFAWPEIRDYAKGLHNPTSLPYNYTTNLAVLVAVVWVVVLGGAAIAFRVRRH